jgi:hypothetical protein
MVARPILKMVRDSSRRPCLRVTAGFQPDPLPRKPKRNHQNMNLLSKMALGCAALIGFSAIPVTADARDSRKHYYSSDRYDGHRSGRYYKSRPRVVYRSSPHRSYYSRSYRSYPRSYYSGSSRYYGYPGYSYYRSRRPYGDYYRSSGPSFSLSFGNGGYYGW